MPPFHFFYFSRHSFRNDLEVCTQLNIKDTSVQVFSFQFLKTFYQHMIFFNPLSGNSIK